jgi:DNA-dependent RNA polymerase auxiliary subunit epsilon
MKIGIYGKNLVTDRIVCFDAILAESLEAGIDFYTRKLEDVPNTEYTEIGYVDLEEENLFGIGAEKHDGVWYSHFSAKVGGWEYVKQERNHLLFISDWTALTDSSLSPEKKTEWVEYRQTLRDIPQTFSLPTDVVFPTQPE